MKRKDTRSGWLLVALVCAAFALGQAPATAFAAADGGDSAGGPAAVLEAAALGGPSPGT